MPTTYQRREYNDLYRKMPERGLASSRPRRFKPARGRRKPTTTWIWSRSSTRKRTNEMKNQTRWWKTVSWMKRCSATLYIIHIFLCKIILHIHTHIREELWQSVILRWCGENWQHGAEHISGLMGGIQKRMYMCSRRGTLYLSFECGLKTDNKRSYGGECARVKETRDFSRAAATTEKGPRKIEAPQKIW